MAPCAGPLAGPAENEAACLDESLLAPVAMSDAWRSRTRAARAGEVAISIERGARFLWPDLDAPYYADPAAAVERLALKGWCQGAMTPDAPVVHASVAGRYLAADVTYLRSLLGQIEPLEGIAGYARAVRSAPDFPDAPRALAMQGFASLAQGLAPEAQTVFERLLRDHPASPYAGVARMGRAEALRVRGRLEDARRVLAAIPETVPRGWHCDVLAERAALARATRRFADAMALDARVGRDCPQFDARPDTIAERAETLLALGRRTAARELLLRPVPSLAEESQAALLVRAADLAREDHDMDAARDALERAQGLRIGAATRATVSARLARLDAVVDLGRAQGRLETLATTAPTPAAHAEVLGLLAATLADAGQFGPALRRLETTTDAPSALVLAHRDAVLARWITSLDAANDGPGVAVLYARHHLAIDTRAASPTARQVARALMDLGLAAPALRLLRLRDPGDDPGHALAIAEAALANQDLEAARAALTRVTTLAPAGELALSVTRLQARVAAAEGRPDRVAMDAVVVDADLAATLGRAWVARGDAAVARGDRTAATQAYEQARRLAPDGPMALAASAGLVQLRAGVADESALASLARSDEPILQRAVMLLGTTQGLHALSAPARDGEGAHGR